jgi:hypothetical protein
MWLSAQDEECIYIAREASQCYINERHFDPRMPTRTHHIENHVSCASYQMVKQIVKLFRERYAKT